MNYSDVYDAEKKAWENATKFPCSDLDRHSFRVGFEKCAEWLSCLGWHPASEPPTIPDGKSAVEIVVLYTQKDGQLYSTQIRFPKWDKWEELNKYNQVKWWCYSPKEGN